LNDGSDWVTSAEAPPKFLARYSPAASLFTSCTDRPPGRFSDLAGVSVRSAASARSLSSRAVSTLAGAGFLSGFRSGRFGGLRSTRGGGLSSILSPASGFVGFAATRGGGG